MSTIDFIKVLAVAFVTLFPEVNPVGDAPIRLALTERYLSELDHQRPDLFQGSMYVSETYLRTG
jgi:hypothetical protein